MVGRSAGGDMGKALTKAKIAIRHKHRIAKNRMTSVCSISTSFDRVVLRWKRNVGDDIKGLIYVSTLDHNPSGSVRWLLDCTRYQLTETRIDGSQRRVDALSLLLCQPIVVGFQLGTNRQ